MQLGMKEVLSSFTHLIHERPLCIQSIHLPLKPLPPNSGVLLDALLAIWVSKQNKIEMIFV